jgi:hypothetical protein
MYSAEYWETVAEEITILKRQREELSKRIHNLQVRLNNHNKLNKEHKTRTDTEVYQMFGKSLKELSQEEYRIYYNARQKINRQKRKERKKKEKQAI